MLWAAATSRAAERTGWGGRASALMGAANPVISFGGNAHFSLSGTDAALVLRGTRQICFVQMGGFDTHASPGTVGGMAAVWRALKAIGMADRLTLFTQSDFGRTFAPKSSAGTDHALGDEHLVMGAAVNGRTTCGRYPELALGGPDDMGLNAWELQGRWIPTQSVDPCAATLLKWWGMNDGQLWSTSPNLANFRSARDLDFLRA